MSKTIQNFYKTTISQDWSIGTGTFYVVIKPTVAIGWLVISPNNATLREIVAYTSTGTDANGDYIVVSTRGVGGTIEQAHTLGEPIRMNITAEYWADMVNDITSVVAGGTVPATTIVKGIVKMSVAPVDSANPIAVGDNDTRLVVSPAKSADIQTFTSSGTWTKPTGAKSVQIITVGAGGGGKSGGIDSGGGGGACAIQTYTASFLGSTETITVGTGGTPGNAGGNSTFGTKVKATGGGGGGGSGTGGTGGAVNNMGVASGNGLSGQGTTATVANVGNAEWGGGAGAPWNNSYNAIGSSSVYAGGGGGQGGDAGNAGTAGGTCGSYTNGGGGAGGASGVNGTAGASNTTIGKGYGGAGGGGGGSGTTTGGAGGFPGGGGGGGGSTGTGGTGGAGQITVTTFF